MRLLFNLNFSPGVDIKPEQYFIKCFFLSLGALTKGDRRAASGSDLSEFDVDSWFGRRSLKRLLDCMAPDPPYMPSKGSNALLNLYILNSDDALLRAKGQLDRWQFALRKAKASLEAIGIDASSDTRKNNSVKVFLNRIAALTVAEQNLVFGLVRIDNGYFVGPFRCYLILFCNIRHLSISL